MAARRRLRFPSFRRNAWTIASGLLAIDWRSDPETSTGFGLVAQVVRAHA
jgi:hypothetical protein